MRHGPSRFDGQVGGCKVVIHRVMGLNSVLQTVHPIGVKQNWVTCQNRRGSLQTGPENRV